MSSLRFEGDVIVVTGAGGGMGRDASAAGSRNAERSAGQDTPR